MPKTKNLKLPQEVRDYHKNKERQKRGWKCKTCGGKPDIKTLDTKEKYCNTCYIQKLNGKTACVQSV